MKETCPADVVNIPQNQHSQRKATRHLTTYWPLTATILVAVCFLFAGYWSWKFSGTDSGAMNGITNILKYAYQRAPVTDPDHWLPFLQMPFIDLTLTVSDDKWKQTTVQGSIDVHMQGRQYPSLEEVVYSIKSGSKVLIEGSPGIGKSTLARHIAKQWAEGKLLQSFPLVLFVQLGRIPSSRITNLESMLDYHSYGYPDTVMVARELGRTGGEGICFLLDGLDEYSSQNPVNNDYIYQLIMGHRLPRAAIIVTSRPSASYRFEPHFTKKIEVLGFSEHQIQRYISALQSNNAAVISEYLNRHPNVKSVSYLPLNLAMVIYLALHSNGVTLLELDTDTKIYQMFVNLTFRQRYKDVENLDKVHRQAFSALSKAAFDATTRVRNSETSLQLHNLDPESRAKLESFSILTINKQYEEDKVSETFTFSHYTFQEFFAAYYLTTLPHEEQLYSKTGFGV